MKYKQFPALLNAGRKLHEDSEKLDDHNTTQLSYHRIANQRHGFFTDCFHAPAHLLPTAYRKYTSMKASDQFPNSSRLFSSIEHTFGYYQKMK